MADKLFCRLLAVPLSLMLFLVGCKAQPDFRVALQQEQEEASVPRSGVPVPPIKTWLCYYDDRQGPEEYSRFDLVVLDGHHHPPLVRTSGDHPLFLGYLSVGEVDVTGPLWSAARGQPFIVQYDEFWDSWIVDVRDPAWQQLVYEDADAILSQGFDGLFLDTIDSSLSLLEGDEKLTYQGTVEALQHILNSLRTKHPGKYIAINRGLDALPSLAPLIDIVVIEDLYSYYPDDEQGYIKVDRQARDLLLSQAEEGVRINPNLTILTLDYADSDQVDLAREAIDFSRAKGFIPYVSTIELDQIFNHTLHY